MKLLLLCEGDAEAWDSWSGISKSLVDHLRAAGHSVEVADIDVSGLDRWLAAAATIRTDRHRWATRYHLCATPFWLRSKRAGRRFAEQSTPMHFPYGR